MQANAQHYFMTLWHCDEVELTPADVAPHFAHPLSLPLAPDVRTICKLREGLVQDQGQQFLWQR